jgi:hypothetical protein
MVLSPENDILKPYLWAKVSQWPLDCRDLGLIPVGFVADTVALVLFYMPVLFH